MADAPVPALQHKIIEIVVDPPNTIIRRVVPVTTQEKDTPVGSRLLSAEETSGRMSRKANPEIVRPGDPVRLVNDTTKSGNVFAVLKSGEFQIHFDDGTKGRYEAKDLVKAY